MWQKCGEQRGQTHDRPGRREKARDSCNRLAKPSPGRGEIPTEREALKALVHLINFKCLGKSEEIR